MGFSYSFHREDELKAALAAHEEVDVLQKLCEGRKVPADLRLALWKVRGSNYRVLLSFLRVWCRNVWECLVGQTLWDCGVALLTARARISFTHSASRLQVYIWLKTCVLLEIKFSYPHYKMYIPTQFQEQNFTIIMTKFVNFFCHIFLSLFSAKLPLDETSRQTAAQDMELVVSYYCKTRNLRYSPGQGWAEILLVLASLEMSRADLFNCFYAMLAKYIPRYA